MAKKSEGFPVTPEVTKPRTVETRRFSAGKASSGNSDEKIVPHYLRASTGSCHDFCKYGRKHAFEEKERRSIPDRATRKQLHQSSEKSIGGIMVSAARLRGSVDSKMSIVKLRESIDSEPLTSDTSDASKHELPTKSFDSKKQIGNDVLADRKKTSLVKLEPSRLLKSHTSPSAREEISSTSKNVETLSKSTSKKVEAPSRSISMKVKPLSKLTSNKVETPSRSNSKVKTSSKSASKMVQTSSKAYPSKGKEMKLSEKHVTSLNPNSATGKTMFSMNSSKVVGGQRNSETKMEKGAASSKTASRKLMAPIRAPVSPRPSLRRVASLNSRKHKSLQILSHLKNQRTARKVEPEEPNDNEVEEKTLYVIKMESGNKTLQSDQNASYDDEPSLPQLLSPKFLPPSISQSLSQEDQEESEYTSSEYEEDSFSGNHELEYMENETLEVEEKGKPRKGGIVCSEDKDCQMLKLKFRRGKVVENQIERNSPRRLKFWRAKLLGEKANVKADAQRKSFKRRDEGCDDGTGATTGPAKVVLRHQDTQDKKDAQGLFNNVIEETASKLVETRKSKVKALVGAFETVISLQEKKPSANTVS